MTSKNKVLDHASLTARNSTPVADGPEDSGFAIFSATQIGESNKRRVLQMLFDLGPTSRAELARLTGTKRTTITGIVQPLIEAGLLIEVDPNEKRGVGKPARPLWFSASAAPVCAVFLMPDKVETALISLTGGVSAHRQVPIAPGKRNRETYIDALVAGVDHALAQAPRQALGIGVAVGGMVDPADGSIVAMNLAPAMAGLGLRDLLEDRFALPTIVDHHPRALLLGERWFGAGRGMGNFAVIYADEVLGCAMYLDGKPFRGPHGSGGELGHTIVDLNGGTCTCGKRGCWETVATLGWLRDRAAEAGLPGAERLDSERLVDLSAQMPAAGALLSRYAHNIAIGIANLQTLLMPDNFIIYGDVRRGGEIMQQFLTREISGLAASLPGNPITVFLGQNEQTITLQGAAGLIVSKQLEIEY
ncbi:ROK family transcriptional regulator [Frigidibacter sp. SD6-1]|uniref:ROK family transcriptional regulator n=1 Tax=Frigidibacter sp. SD6-1 TaxID=3032581 RepID=UPI0024DF5758|nr:ROK family transcriptional regulator [Frigidibacter sp. SD6-1]